MLTPDLPLPERQPIRIHRCPLTSTSGHIIVTPGPQCLLGLFLKLVRISGHCREDVLEQTISVDLTLVGSVLAGGFGFRGILYARHCDELGESSEMLAVEQWGNEGTGANERAREVQKGCGFECSLDLLMRSNYRRGE